jgi:DNA-directed RNA polymerase subunit RPC12/RpoP
MDWEKDLKRRGFKVVKEIDGEGICRRIFGEKKEKKKEIEDFECPDCGSKEFRAIYFPIGEVVYGGRTPCRIIAYECEGCSRHFGDPKKFSKSKKK